MQRGAAGLGAAWLCSCTPLALPNLWPAAGPLFSDASATALAALPWIAWMGVPFAARTAREPAADLVSEAERSLAWPAALLAVPPIACGLAIDHGRGASLGHLALAALVAIAMVALLLAAAARAAREPRSAAVHAFAWLALVPGLPLLRVALELGGAPAYGAAPRWLAFGAGASPIAWAWRAARDAQSLPAPWAPLAVCLGLCAVGAWRGGPK